MRLLCFVLPMVLALAPCHSGQVPGSAQSDPSKSNSRPALWLELRGVSVTELVIDESGDFSQVVWFGDRLLDARSGKLPPGAWDALGTDALHALVLNLEEPSKYEGAQRPQDEEWISLRLGVAGAEVGTSLPLPLAPTLLTGLLATLRAHAAAAPVRELPWIAIRLQPLRELLGQESDPPSDYLSSRGIEVLAREHLEEGLHPRVDEFARGCPRTYLLSGGDGQRLRALLEADFLRWGSRDFAVAVLHNSPG